VEVKIEESWKRVFILILTVVLSSSLILFLWKSTVLLLVMLLVVSYIKHIFCPIKRELLWFVVVSFGSLLVEVVLVNFGEAWTYAVGHIFGIPIWMPVFWGIVGTTLVDLHERLFS